MSVYKYNLKRLKGYGIPFIARQCLICFLHFLCTSRISNIIHTNYDFDYCIHVYTFTVISVYPMCVILFNHHGLFYEFIQ